MKHWVISPFVLHARGYDVENGFTARKPYDALMTITLLGAGEAYIGATLNKSSSGSFAFDDLQAVGEQLAVIHGVHTVIMERRGRLVKWSVEAIRQGRPPRRNVVHPASASGETDK